MPDRTLRCSDCGAEFAFTEAEQTFFRERGFDNDPKRCITCRRKRRRSTETRREGREGAGAPAPLGDSAQRAPQVALRRRPSPDPATLHRATCTECGAEALVPFQPDGVRPVFCMPCLKRQTR